MNQELKWTIDVRAGGDFESFSQALGGNDIRLGESDGDETGRVLSAYSPHIESLTSAVEVGRRIYSLEVLLNGAIRVCTGKMQPVSIRFPLYFSPDRGWQEVSVDRLDEYPFDSDPSIDADISGFRNPGRNGASHLIYLSKQHEVIRILLFQAGLLSSFTAEARILTWGTLYKMLDTIRHFCKDYHWDEAIFAEPFLVNSFTAACNNMSVLGVYARHGKPDQSQPKRVMTDLSEAMNLLLKMAHRFTHKYILEKSGTAHLIP